MLCLVLACGARVHVPQISDCYGRGEFRSRTGVDIPYRLLTPEESQEGEKYPLVLFLHGAGETGDDNESQLANGASVFSNPVNRTEYPAFVVFPQCAKRYWTSEISDQVFLPGAAVPEESPTEKGVMELVESLADSLPVDRDRIYIVGISMGAIGAYDLVCRYPDTFAAAVPICGAVNVDRLKDAGNVKFLIFHGDSDDEVPTICGREAYRTLKALGNDARYVEFAGAGHDCWSAAFNHPDFLPWLFSQKRSQAPFHKK